MGSPEKTKSRSEGSNTAQAQTSAELQSLPKMQTAEDTQDLVEKEFIGFPDITADILNVLLYQGKNTIKEENLLAGPTEIIYQGAEKLRTQYEDLCRYDMADGKIHLMYLIANQSRTDGKMLLRKGGYTGGVYRGQYEGQMPEAFPVIELVLYWGKSKWKSSRDFHSLFRKKALSEAEWEYIDELKLHVFEMRHLPKKTRELFQSDMRIIADFLAEGESYCSDRKIRHKSALIKMIKVLSGDTDAGSVDQWLEGQGIREEDEVKVCELFDQYERRGRAQGEAKFARLLQILLDGGRNDDLKRAVADQHYRELLYIEVGLV